MENNSLVSVSQKPMLIIQYIKVMLSVESHFAPITRWCSGKCGSRCYYRGCSCIGCGVQRDNFIFELFS